MKLKTTRTLSPSCLFFEYLFWRNKKYFVPLHQKKNKIAERANDMATAIRAIPTLYGETAKSFESEAARTEQDPGTQDYRHEAKVVSNFLKTCTAL